MDLRTLATLPGVPRRRLSRAAGAVARWRVPRALRPRLWGFLAKRLGISRDSVPGQLEDYPHFLSLFTRPLPPDARPIPPGDAWLSPADGILVASTRLCPEGSWLIKGVPYSNRELLGDRDASLYAGYRALQIYLAPRDYHRFHAPCDLKVLAADAQEGDLQPVDPLLVRRSMRVLVRNRRVLLHCRTAGQGTPFALLFVGAFNVGGMRFRFDATLGTPPLSSGRRHYDPPPALAAGDELGHFEFGSTVVLISPPGFRPTVKEGERVYARRPLLEPAPHALRADFDG